MDELAADVKTNNLCTDENLVAIELDPKDRVKLLAKGYEPIPIDGKAPRIPGWSEGAITESRLTDWLRDHPDHLGTGLRCGQLVAVDNDCTDPALATKVQGLVDDDKHLSASPLCRVGRKGCATFYRNETPCSKIVVSGVDRAGNVQKLEILGRGNQVASFGIHPAGMPYRWRKGVSPLDVPYTDLPVVTPGELVFLALDVSELFRREGLTDTQVTGIGNDRRDIDHESTGDMFAWELRERFCYLDPDAPREGWLKWCGALHNTNVVDSHGDAIEFDKREHWLEFCRGELWQGSKADWIDGLPPRYTGDDDAARVFETTRCRSDGAGPGTMLRTRGRAAIPFCPCSTSGSLRFRRKRPRPMTLIRLRQYGRRESRGSGCFRKRSKTPFPSRNILLNA